MRMATNIPHTKIAMDIPQRTGTIIAPETHGEVIAMVIHGTPITMVKMVVVLMAQRHTHGTMIPIGTSLKTTMMDHPMNITQMAHGNIQLLMDQPILAQIETENAYIDL